jgi:hypothetical protein
VPGIVDEHPGALLWAAPSQSLLNSAPRERDRAACRPLAAAAPSAMVMSMALGESSVED